MEIWNGEELRTGQREQGIVRIIPVKANANTRSLTVEQLIGQKKQLHLGSFRYILDGLKSKLWEIVESNNAIGSLQKDLSVQTGLEDVKGFVFRILSQCEEIFKEHERLGPKEYGDLQLFRGLVQEMLDAEAMACSKLCWWFEDNTQFLHGMEMMALRECHLGRIQFLEDLLRRAIRSQDRNMLCDGCRAPVFGVVYNCMACRGSSLCSRCRENHQPGHNFQVALPPPPPKSQPGSSQDHKLRAIESCFVLRHSSDTEQLAGKICSLKGLTDIFYSKSEETFSSRTLRKAEFDISLALIQRAQEGKDLGDIQLLVYARADMNAVRHGQTALMAAAGGGYTTTVSALLSFGALPFVAGCNSAGTALHRAAMGGYNDIIWKLVLYSADVNCATLDGFTPLMAAAKRGRVLTVGYLLELRANVAATTNGGITALSMAEELSRQTSYRSDPSRSMHEKTVSLLRRAWRVLPPMPEPPPLLRREAAAEYRRERCAPPTFFSVADDLIADRHERTGEFSAVVVEFQRGCKEADLEDAAVRIQRFFRHSARRARLRVHKRK